MSLRLSFDIDEDSPLHDERWSREPPVMDHVTLRQGTIRGLMDTATTVGLADPEARRMASLLGAKVHTKPSPEEGHRIETSENKRELVALLTETIEGIETKVETDRSLKTIARADSETRESMLADRDQSLFETYRVARRLRNQVAFALEHDIDLHIA